MSVTIGPSSAKASSIDRYLINKPFRFRRLELTLLKRKLMVNQVHILGARGIPATHGGFEYFAEHLALYLTQRGWAVTVYCQIDGEGEVYEDHYQGIKRVNIPEKRSNALGTIIFDWKATLISSKGKGAMLTLGYNTAVFGLLYRLRGIPNVINMDGIEWRRAKWGPIAKLWFYLNDWLGCWLGNALIADNPGIQQHLETRVNRRKISMIPYGAHAIDHADKSVLDEFGLEKSSYFIVIARPVPENSVLEIVKTFSRKRRGLKLVILGNYRADNAFECNVVNAASDEVMFPGAIFDKRIVEALRYFARGYIHGHTVGGTNPSLVEALAAGSPIIAHDNIYNSWVAGKAGKYFSSPNELEQHIEELSGSDKLVCRLKEASRLRHSEAFTWENVLASYENILTRHLR